VNCVKGLYADHGIVGLYHGIAPAVIREAIGSAAFFTAYEVTKARICQFMGTEKRKAGNSVIMFSGGIAGIAYVLVAHPLETAAVLMQLDNISQPKYKGMVDCLRQVVAERGFVGLYKGVGPTLVRAFPSYGAAFYGYEQTLKAVQRSEYMNS